jgi:hypothetical protein
MANPEQHAVFSEEEKARIRYHLGYLNTDPVLSLQLGTPAVSQESFIVEGAMDRVRISAAGIVRGLLAECDAVEGELKACRRRMRAESVGEVTLRADEAAALDGEYARWTMRLSEVLGAPRNPLSQRFGGGRAPLNVRVHH